MSLALIWLILMVAFCVIEGFTSGLVSIWFALGAVAALIAALLGAGFVLQFILFAAVSVLTILLLRPFASRILKTRHEATNADRIIGQEAVVIVPVSGEKGTGQVRVDGSIWTAKYSGPGEIPEGARVVIRGIEGVKAVVEPLPGNPLQQKQSGPGPAEGKQERSWK